MKAIAINKHGSKLKGWNVELPNAPYSKRYEQFFNTSRPKIG